MFLMPSIVIAQQTYEHKGVPIITFIICAVLTNSLAKRFRLSCSTSVFLFSGNMLAYSFYLIRVLNLNIQYTALWFYCIVLTTFEISFNKKDFKHLYFLILPLIKSVDSANNILFVLWLSYRSCFGETFAGILHSSKVQGKILQKYLFSELPSY